MGTFSKTFATTGGFVAGDEKIIRNIRYLSRPYIFSAHISPLNAATVLAGIELLENEPSIVEKLHENIKYTVEQLRDIGIDVSYQGSAIIPILVPEDHSIRKLCKEISDLGIFINSIEFPAVPAKLQRLRISIMGNPY